ncbi:hypothetical protein LX32DRAFT_641160 [Colletotrichum zoysiae]|uniref:Uncharacterized protein n=1 Tax=Colletotrichum zoysiae TaxID=1216348 RepID=A0AAD9M014_9PEZI|nr:hypothetical protein LX32DRAFT_641160 [Colletotrichum zoysiae]
MAVFNGRSLFFQQMVGSVSLSPGAASSSSAGACTARNGGLLVQYPYRLSTYQSARQTHGRQRQCVVFMLVTTDSRVLASAGRV